MIVAGNLLLPSSADQSRLAAGWLRIENRRIVEVAEGPCPHSIAFGGDDYFVSPGFIDTHVHLPQFDSIGCAGLPLLEWLNTNIFPMERRWEDDAFAASMTSRVLDQFLLHGTTSFCAYATVHHAGTLAALELTHQRGFRACIGQTLMDRLAPDYLMRPTRQLIAEASELLAKFPPGGPSRVECGITPRFAASCTPDLMQEVAKIAKSTGAIVQTHLAETIPECTWVESLFDGKPYTDVYRQMGLLGDRTILGHGIYLHEQERRWIGESESVIAHCPNANIFLGSGVMPWRLWKKENLRLSLGTDIGAGFDVSMPRVARSMIESAKLLRLSQPDLTPPNAAEAWHTITQGNANAAGWLHVGRLTAGAEADLLVVRPNIIWRTAADPLSMLLYAWESAWIETRILNGKVLSAVDLRP
jgi:guanine deaminase